MTPIAKQKCSKRSFAGQVTSWKKRVYAFVAKMEEEEEKRKKERLGWRSVKKEEGGGNAQGGEDDKGSGVVDIDIYEGKKMKEVTDKDDGVLSDMEDIELDDYGNVVAQSDVTPTSSEQDVNELDVGKQDDLRPSIFDEF